MFKRQASVPMVQPDRNDGISAISFYGNWIIDADTKIGFLATGLTALGAAGFVQLRKFIESAPFDGWRDLFAGFMTLMALAGIAVGAVFLVAALTPRTAAPVGFSRYAYPSLATQPPGFVPALDADKQREEAWIQARALSLIAMKKFTFFRRGLYAFVVSAPTLGIAAILIR
ncbi:hypothetical protein [Micromonospora antibiotica]|uniref:Pycsar effector protein domain-containing protein n=1 Tax=Micromonospora antibiotica TaxID=2807623 RepID=A0ABS3VFJ9_9ACTN|nr:hypothetical protein [Micromonospora antibiotica]MBO4164404.1 hypothetical protein [Micromonospora antibiotica]